MNVSSFREYTQLAEKGRETLESPTVGIILSGSATVRQTLKLEYVGKYTIAPLQSLPIAQKFSGISIQNATRRKALLQSRPLLPEFLTSVGVRRDEIKTPVTVMTLRIGESLRGELFIS